MTKHLVRNFFGILVLYIIIIFGIFAIQFRKELSIFENFTIFNLHLIQNDSETIHPLQNSFEIKGNGFIIYADDNNPLILKNHTGGDIPLILQDWEKRSDEEFLLQFSEDISLNFKTHEAKLTITLEGPVANAIVKIPYSVNNTFSTTDIKTDRIIVQAQENIFSLYAEDIAENQMTLTNYGYGFAEIGPYVEQKGFTFDSIIGMDNTSKEKLSDIISNAVQYIVTSFETSPKIITDEKYVTAYIAEKARMGLYRSAISSVSETFIAGSNRSYLSAPYFENLVNMHKTLIEENANIKALMISAVSNKNVSVFATENFAQFLLRQDISDIQEILKLPASLTEFNPSLLEAIGIIEAYMSLVDIQPTSAMYLEPVLETAVKRIETACVLSTETLSLLIDEEENADVHTMIKAGSVLNQYGIFTNNEIIQSGATMLLVSTLENYKSIKPSLIASVYPYLVKDNPYYPHADILGYNGETPIWMWNILPHKTFERDQNGTISMDLHFTITEVYHSIISGIEPFESIQLRNIDNYPSDPQFEIYIAPGYVYNMAEKTLLLRYNQKTEVEHLKIFYDTEAEIE